MSLSDDPTSPTKKNQASTSQEPRESPQDSSFLQSVETKMSPSDDPTEKNRARTGQEPGESPEDSSFFSSKEPHVTSRSFVSPMHRDEEALKSQHGSFWENPNYFGGNMGSETYSGYANNDQNVDASNNSVDSDTLFADSNKASLPYDNLEGSLDSAGNNDHNVDARNNSAGMPQQMSNSSAVGVDSDTLFTEYTEEYFQQAYANYLQILKMEGEEYGTKNLDSFGDQSNFLCVAGSQENPIGFDTYKAMFEDKRKREEIKMMPTPRSVNAPPEWTFRMTLTKDDVDPAIGHLTLPASFINLHIESHMAKQSEVTLKVYDHDWGTMHELRLASNSKHYDGYALMGDWVKDFTQRRGLCEGDEIGLLWDSSSSMLKFGVVSRVKETKLQKEEIEMMPINRVVWPIKKILSKTDVAVP